MKETHHTKGINNQRYLYSSFFTVIQSQWSIACGCKECASALSRHHLHNIVSSIVCVFFKESSATNLDGKRSIIHHHLFIGNAKRLKEVV